MMQLPKLRGKGFVRGRQGWLAGLVLTAGRRLPSHRLDLKLKVPLLPRWSG